MITREQARQVLHDYRPWSENAGSREFAEALEWTSQDAELKEWFEAHCAVQSALREQFKRIRAPEGLREQILSEYRARTQPKRSLKPAFAAVAVVALVLVVVEAIFLFGPKRIGEDLTLTGFQNRMAKTALRMYDMYETNNLDAIHTYLIQKKRIADYELPENLKSAPATGALALTWQGKPVSMICFRTGKPLPPGQTSDLFLFVVSQASVPGAPTSSAPQFRKVNELLMATWSLDGKTYVLATEGTESDLKQYLLKANPGARPSA